MDILRRTFPGILLLASLLTADPSLNLKADGYHRADFPSTINEMKDVFQGIKTFASKIKIISETLGAGTIILLIFVLLLSSGFSAIGLPKGKITFLTSLFVADAFWLLWKISFKEPPGGYLLSMIKSNVILLMPLMTMVLVKILFPSFKEKLKGIFLRLRQGKKTAFSREFIITSQDELHSAGASLNRALTRDILQGEEKKVVLSHESLEYLDRLKRVLEKIKPR